MTAPLIRIPVSIDSTAAASIRALTMQHTTLEKLMTWGMMQTPSVMIADVIQQDEFTSDVIVPFQDNLFFVYDVT